MLHEEPLLVVPVRYAVPCGAHKTCSALQVSVPERSNYLCLLRMTMHMPAIPCIIFVW